MTPTAVEGGHVTDLAASNAIIRDIVERRNQGREIDIDEDGEVARDVEQAVDMDASPLPSDSECEMNPKDRIGSTKLPLHLFPDAAVAYGCLAMLNGALKYGRANWRHSGVRASIYVDATRRHLAAWLEGEDSDEEGVPHLGAAIACIAILIDAEVSSTLIDDRNFRGGYLQAVADLTRRVAEIKARHADKSPRHFTIADNE
jgi:hypothetical protein